MQSAVLLTRDDLARPTADTEDLILGNDLPKAPEPYIELKASRASARVVFEKALRDGYKRLDCALMVAGLFNLDFREARRIGFELTRSQQTSASGD
jgi:hypothetical protein